MDSVQVSAVRPAVAAAMPGTAFDRSGDDRRWAAVLARDAAADGAFVTGVRTTGIYCRPSCAARHPKRENVTFYPDPAAAEGAGLRACLRCRPNGPSRASRDAAAVALACRAIEAAETEPGLAELAAGAGLSTFHFHRIFKAATGLTPKAYAAARRAGRLRDALSSEGASVTAAIYEAGFNSSGRFYARSDAVLGMTPRDFRAGGREATIRFATGASTLGTVLAAATERGVCAVFIGDDPTALEADLRRRFPRATLLAGDESFRATLDAVIRLVDAPAQGADLPLDIRGTAFQQRVWEALMRVPAGETTTYADVARAIGEPAAVRAVAGACAANRIAVAVPCHRVLRSDGGLSGYRWGVGRKRELLDRESGKISRSPPPNE